MSDKDLTPIEQQEVPFYDDMIPAVRMENGAIYIAVKPLCENIGIAWQSQWRKLKNDPILAKKLRSVTFMVTDKTVERTRAIDMIALPLQDTHGWLFRIDSRRVKREVRDDLIRYQERCYKVLADAFSPEKSDVGKLWRRYKKAGYSDQWIKNRLRGINIRTELTREWSERGVEGDEQYASLTDTISRGTFDLTTQEHRELKALEVRHGLRDHMSNLELILAALGEESTREIAVEQEAQGFEENETAAKIGGTIAGNARREIEAQTGKRVVTPDNFLPENKQPTLLDAPDDN